MKVIGIDPGLKGAICLMTKGEKLEVQMHKMPIEEGIVDVRGLKELLEGFEATRTYVEHAFALPGMNSKAMFSYAENFGRLLSVFEASDEGYTLVRPATWQAFYKFNLEAKSTEIGTSSRKKETKAIARRAAHGILLQEKTSFELKSDGHIDAFLIAYYALTHR